MTATDTLRDEVRRKYAEAAVAVAEESGCGCGSGACCDGDASEDFGTALYTLEQRGELPDAAAKILKGEVRGRIVVKIA